MTIQVYAFSTPNSVKVPIALEELQLPYELKSVNVRKGEQKNQDFLALNPNGKVPVLIDSAGMPGGPLVLAESAAILVYLAEKTGRLLPASGESRARVFEQLFFHASGLGPAFGQSGYFQKQSPEQLPPAITRFSTEAARVARLLDQVLSRSEFSAGTSSQSRISRTSVGFGVASLPELPSHNCRTYSAGMTKCSLGRPCARQSIA